VSPFGIRMIHEGSLSQASLVDCAEQSSASQPAAELCSAQSTSEVFTWTYLKVQPRTWYKEVWTRPSESTPTSRK